MTFYLNFNFTFQGHMGATVCGTPLLALTVLPISLGVFIMYSGFLLKDELVPEVIVDNCYMTSAQGYVMALCNALVIILNSTSHYFLATHADYLSIFLYSISILISIYFKYH